MQHQLKRQWEILNIIPMPPSPGKSTEEICRTLCEITGAAIGKRTVERDLQTLIDDFDIDFHVEGKTHYWAWQDVPKMWLPGLSREQALAFFMVKRNLKGLLPEATLLSLDPFFQAAEQKLDAMPKGVRSWKKKFRLIESGQMLTSPEINAEALRVIREALLFDNPINVHCHDRSGKTEMQLSLLPLAITQRGAELYLVYRDLDESEIRFIPMQRINRARPSIADHPPIGMFDIDAYIESGQLGFGKQYPIRVGETISLQALFSEKTAQRLRETPISGDQKIAPEKDGRMKITASVKFSGQLFWWLLSYGASVEVLRPAKLRKLISDTLRKAVTNYES